MSKRYWVIAPYDSTYSDIFEKAWKYDLTNGTIAIGWDELGDVSRLNKSEIKSRYEKTYGGKPGEISYGTNTIWKFYHEIKVGDVVIARCGRMKIRGIGTVTSQTFFDEKMGINRVGGLTDDTCSHFIKVEWGEVMNFEFGELIFLRQTIGEFTGAKYNSLLEEIFENLGLEDEDLDDVPEVKEVVSRRIERGKTANKAKELTGYKCLICKSLGENPYCFKKKDGKYYIEAHHVTPVSSLEKGTLALSNIITVCPNHHRQLHYGNSLPPEDIEDKFVFTIDGQTVEVEKLRLAN